MLQAGVAVLGAAGVAGLLLTAWLFARSLLPGSTPLVYRFALSEDPFTAQRSGARRYLWWLTLSWVFLLLGCAGVMAARLWRDDIAAPALLMAPPIAGALLFLGERQLRAVVFGAGSLGSIAKQWRNATSILRDEAAGCFRFECADSFPLFRKDSDDRILVVWKDAQCTVGEFRHAAHALSEELPAGPRALVACDDRATFLWAVLACWSARRTVVLPPPDMAQMLTAAGQTYFDCVITDRADFAAGNHAELKRINFSQLQHALLNTRTTNGSDALPASHNAAVFFTSGSSGTPVAQAKTWRQLVEAAAAMSELLQMRDSHPLVGGTVVHSHMFGFEMLVMQALHGSARVYANRVVYPSDLLAFAATSGFEKWLVTTPYHLGVFVDAGKWAPGLQRIVSATMPLDRELATSVEEACGAEVHEIYGSTEAGCIATRRTRFDEAWRPSADLRISIEHGKARLHGRRVGGTLALSDRIELQADGFRLLGRDSDLVKVAGKRASLQGLTQILCGIEGVKEGCFVDSTRFGQKRLAAVVVAPGMSGKSLREAMAAVIDATFLPRPLLLVNELPRDANGKLRIDKLPWPTSHSPDASDRAIVEARLSDAA